MDRTQPRLTLLRSRTELPFQSTMRWERYVCTALAASEFELLDAHKLLDWMHSKWREGPYVSLPDIVQFGPNATRDTTAAKRLIAILEDHRHLERMPGPLMVNGKMRREVWRIVGAAHA